MLLGCGCETHTSSYVLFTYVCSTTLVELQTMYLAYHNILLMFLVMAKYESTSYLRMHMLINNYIIKDILATSLSLSSRIRNHWCRLLELHVMLDDCIIILVGYPAASLPGFARVPCRLPPSLPHSIPPALPNTLPPFLPRITRLHPRYL